MESDSKCWMSAYISPPTLLAPLSLERERMQEVEEEVVETSSCVNIYLTWLVRWISHRITTKMYYNPKYFTGF